ncbi:MULTISPECIES: tryptophanase leader peptide [Pectobacterium]|uniref:Tryptophanase leader peptide n=1 Tax=Pectobacterium brasiliense TaxID=180957 RepID=A0AAW9GXY8_9GAMM|nr:MULTISPECIES: tryptophanase leader peptide [Pectobacterium]UKE85020.1 tryptophanase leader peptide [Pectobacterium sp. PL152]KHT07161.1 tryptophanase [Pectobacterium brasiliense]MBA0209944.1 tryptophanase leader peptide [Pectobacterium brasiliense]MBN3080747.1 tryptophanase leader peptide [Pectobacterium polaris]MBN3099323.1 tryptophanase leader peptide [Pectobacterium brasiliense]
MARIIQRYRLSISGDCRAWFNIDHRLTNDFPRPPHA